MEIKKSLPEILNKEKGNRIIMKRMFHAVMLILLLIPTVVGAQITSDTNTIQATQPTQATQTIRGQVCDVASGDPIIGVTVQVDDESTATAISDIDGNFVIMNVLWTKGEKT